MLAVTGYEPFHDEERMYLYSALEDMMFARSFLRRIGRTERDRFSKMGFAYGDSSYLGYSPYDVYEEQLNIILYTLFGRGYSGELFSVPVYDDDERLLEEISALDGGPLQIEEDRYYAGADYEEVLITEIRAEGSPPGDSGAASAVGGEPTGRQRIDALITALRRTWGEGPAPGLHRWNSESERTLALMNAETSTNTVLFLSGCEPYAGQELMRKTIFERLTRAWSEFVPPQEDSTEPA